MTEPNPTVAKMLQAQEQCVRDARAIAMMVDGHERAARMVYVDALDATAALLRRLSEPSDDVLVAMEDAARASRVAGMLAKRDAGQPLVTEDPDRIAAMRAAVAALLTGEASDAQR